MASSNVSVVPYSTAYVVKMFTAQHDPETENWFLMNPVYLSIILVSYFSFILVVGPRMLKNRPAMNLKKVMIAYNIIQIGVNACIIYEILTEIVFPGQLRLFCEGQNPHFECSMNIKRGTEIVHMYYVSRVFDLADTIFIVLKKKSNQLSFLHIYHHLLMGSLGWIAVYTGFGVRVFLLGLLNCAVHIIMYFYYLLTVINPEYRKSVWWKKHLTQIQIMQFLIILIQQLITFVNPSCPTKYKIVSSVFFPQIVIILTLFLEFYRQNYIAVKNKNK